MSKTKKKNIAPCVDVVGRKVKWKSSVTGDYLYGEVIRVFLQLYKPDKPKYDLQRFLRKYITIELNDGRVMNFAADSKQGNAAALVVDS